MGRSRTRRPKRRSEAQKANILKAQQTLAIRRAETSLQAAPTATPPPTNTPPPRIIEQLKTLQKNAVARFWNERRRYHRFKAANHGRKESIAALKKEVSMLRAQLDISQRKLSEIEETAAETIKVQAKRLEDMTRMKQEAVRERTLLSKKHKRFQSVKATAIRQASAKALKSMKTFRLTRRGIYTAEARAAMRTLSSLGTAEGQVGTAFQAVGKLMGVEIDRKVSKRTVGRAKKELGVAADVQVGYEMSLTTKIAYSSDSTSHKHINYESRKLDLPVPDYENMSEEPKWQSRSLGVGTSVNHSSETQVQGLKDRLLEISKTFNSSPLAKRESMTFVPDDFVCKLTGTSGDHAADQKKSHSILATWRMETIFCRMGSQAVIDLDAATLFQILIPEKVRLVNEAGGYDAWMALSPADKDLSNQKMYQAIGKRLFDDLPEDEQVSLSRFIRTGCCMHKDLNTFKGGDREMGAMWATLQQTPPLILANKDRTLILEGCADPRNPTALEKQALEASKRGGTHTTTLGGMICRNKDSKKGQQQTYLSFMERHVKHYVAYPDVSNTRYGTHGEAAVVLVLHREHFIHFMECVRDTKDRPGFTNIEQNFYNALKDEPTFTELCVLALYCLCVSRPFMAHVRSHHNILELEEFFQSKSNFLRKIMQHPEIWSSPGHTHVEATLDGQEWDGWGHKAVTLIRKHSPSLPNLNNAIAAFARGALATFSERFSDEFADDGPVKSMSAAERKELFFASTNDANEGALGGFRIAQRARPAETLHAFNATFVAQQNNTEVFLRTKMAGEEDERFLREKQREIDASGRQAELKRAQVEADAEKAKQNRLKDAQRVEKRAGKKAEIAETGRRLVLTAVEAEKLGVAELNRQLDYHREHEKAFSSTNSATVPLKSHMANKQERTEQLKLAIQRYQLRVSGYPGGSVVVQGQSASAMMAAPAVLNDGDELYLSDHNDDTV